MEKSINSEKRVYLSPEMKVAELPYKMSILCQSGSTMEYGEGGSLDEFFE